MVPMAHAQDGGGSIRIPAAACGVFGLKPSRGRNPDEPTDGPEGNVVELAVSRSVRDSATLLDQLHGSRPVDRWWTPPPTRGFAIAALEDPGPLRIAFTTTDFAGHPAHPDCRDAVHHAARLFESLGHHVEEAAPDIDGNAYNEAFVVQWALVAGAIIKRARQAAAARVPHGLRGLAKSRLGFAMLARVAMSGSGLQPFERFTHRLARIDAAHSPADTWLTARVMRTAGVALRQFLTDYDLLLTPVLGQPPWRTGQFNPHLSDEQLKVSLMQYVGYTQMCNTEGLPAMSLPLFWNIEGLPIGVQVIAPFAAEERLFALAGQADRAQPFDARRPTGLDGRA
jgi:amidase